VGGANGDTLFANENGDEQILYKFDESEYFKESKL
jgi:hypothetical protein